MGIVLRKEDAKSYGEYVVRMTRAWEYIRGCSGFGFAEVAGGLFQSRKYVVNNRRGLLKVLEEVGLAWCPQGIRPPAGDEAVWKELGLLSKDGRVLLEGRYVVPIRDFMGGIMALVGWWDDKKKYITCSGRWFSKSKCVFGMEQAADGYQTNGLFLCEGIFDTLSMRGCGVRAVGCMGIAMTREKRAMLDVVSGGSRVLAVPDNDKAGNEVVANDAWGVRDSLGGYLRWDPKRHGKDIDDMVSSVGEEQGRVLLVSALTQRRGIVRLYS